MKHIQDNGNKNSPQDWDCGGGIAQLSNGDIMGGNDKVEWSPCSVMNFRRHYTRMMASNKWCMQGKRELIQFL